MTKRALCGGAKNSSSRERRYSTRAAVLALVLSGVVVLLAAAQLTCPDEAIAERARVAYSIEVTGVIDRGAQHDLARQLAEAQDRRASVAIVRLDTPGGVLEVTREMAKDISAAPLPVIVYVHPSGAHAQSAGLFLTLAGDVAAMAPGTNIGSATPFLLAPAVNREQRTLLKVLEQKTRNDAIAWARALAEQHGRNAGLAERMVSEAVNVSARRARRQRLVDAVAANERDLLRDLDGFRLRGPKARQLRTAGLAVEHAEIDTGLVDSDGPGDESSFLRSLGSALAWCSR